MSDAAPVIAVLGASGLIGGAVARLLTADGFRVVRVARRFEPSVGNGSDVVSAPIVDLPPEALAALLTEHDVDVVVNCIGVLQDTRRSGTAEEAHAGFAARLVEAIRRLPRPCLLVHVSIPGNETEDETAFSRTKRAADHLIRQSGVPHAIIRPGFVVAPAAYGGSALVRALAALPFALSTRTAFRPFATTDVRDIAATINVAARRWQAGERDWHAVWDVMASEASTVGSVVAAFRRHFGGPAARFAVPEPLMTIGARAGDAASLLGWAPPVRTTALAEMRRGVEGDSAAWRVATGIEPHPLAATLEALPATVQERWFARLYLLKALVIASLALFWLVSGLVALTVAREAAAGILARHGFPLPLATAITVATSLLDIAIGAAIAIRRSCVAGLAAGIAVSLGYMLGAAFLAPELWLDPLGAMVKTGPAVVLMLVALALASDR